MIPQAPSILQCVQNTVKLALALRLDGQTLRLVSHLNHLGILLKLQFWLSSPSAVLKHIPNTALENGEAAALGIML